MVNAVALLMASRKSVVGLGALVADVVLILSYHPPPGGYTLEAALLAVNGVAIAIISAIGKEDAATKSAGDTKGSAQ